MACQMSFMSAVTLVMMLIGGAFVLLTRKGTYQRLHEQAMLTNPFYRRTFPKTPINQKRVLLFHRLLLRTIGLFCVSIGLLVNGLIVIDLFWVSR
jgi:hypothetical protein